MVSRFHFAPTIVARDNLLAEGIKKDQIFVTGNTGIDALRTTVREDYSHNQLTWAQDCKMLLVTAHRRENWGVPMRCMFRAIRRIVEDHEDVKAIFPLHSNPLVRRIANEELMPCDRISLTEPLDVMDFHNFLARSHLILTDSGGIQEEAPSLGKPVIVLRDTTERPEGIAAGTLKLAGTDEQTIYSLVRELLTDREEYARMSHASNPYGDGLASARIAGAILAWKRGRA